MKRRQRSERHWEWLPVSANWSRLENSDRYRKNFKSWCCWCSYVAFLLLLCSCHHQNRKKKTKCLSLWNTPHLSRRQVCSFLQRPSAANSSPGPGSLLFLWLLDSISNNRLHAAVRVQSTQGLSLSCKCPSSVFWSCIKRNYFRVYLSTGWRALEAEVVSHPASQLRLTKCLSPLQPKVSSGPCKQNTAECSLSSSSWSCFYR